MAEFRPTIFVYLCSWCPSVGVDQPEVIEGLRLMDARIEMIRLPCSAAVDPGEVAMSFRRGADGVLWLTCPEGNCHYLRGSETARNRFLLLRKLFAELGCQPQRLRLEPVAHDEPHRFMETLSELREQLFVMGPYSGDKGRQP